MTHPRVETVCTLSVDTLASGVDECGGVASNGVEEAPVPCLYCIPSVSERTTVYQKRGHHHTHGRPSRPTRRHGPQTCPRRSCLTFLTVDFLWGGRKEQSPGHESEDPRTPAPGVSCCGDPSSQCAAPPLSALDPEPLGPYTESASHEEEGPGSHGCLGRWG